MKPRKSKQTTTTLGQELIRGLTTFRDAVNSGEPLEKRFVVSELGRPVGPKPLGARRVKTIRERVGASQAVFAALVGVSTKTIQAWEQGANEPPLLACRLLELMDEDPARWRHELATATGRRAG